MALSDIQPDKRRGFRLRFGLRFLFALLLLCAVASLWVQRRLVMLEKQWRAMERLSAVDARIETEPAVTRWFWRYVPRWLIPR